MKRFAVGLLWSAMVLGSGAAGRCLAQQPSLPREASEALQQFLDVDCEIDNRVPALDQLLKFKAALEPRLIKLLKEGPDKQVLDEAQRSLEARWSEREVFLRKNPELGLKGSDLEASKAVTKEAYVNQGRAQLVRKYQEKAAIGLAAIGSPEALKALREASEKADEGLRAVIQSALPKFRRK